MGPGPPDNRPAAGDGAHGGPGSLGPGPSAWIPGADCTGAPPIPTLGSGLTWETPAAAESHLLPRCPPLPTAQGTPHLLDWGPCRRFWVPRRPRRCRPGVQVELVPRAALQWQERSAAVVQQGCCFPPPQKASRCSEDARLSPPAPPTSPQTPWGRRRVVDRLRAPLPQGLHALGDEVPQVGEPAATGYLDGDGGGDPPGAHLCPLPTGYLDGDGDGGGDPPRSPPVPPPHAHSGEDAVRGHGGSGAGERPAPRESPRPSSPQRGLGTHALPGSCGTGRAGAGRRGWGCAGSYGPPLSFRPSPGAPGPRASGKAKACPSLGAGLRERAGLMQGWAQRAGPVWVGPGVGGAQDLELREVGGAQAEGRDLSVPVHPVGGVSTRL